MGIPLAIFYFAYLIAVLVFLFFTFFNVYHLIRFGFLTIGNIAMITMYILVTIAILMISWFYIRQIDWLQVIPLASQFDF